MQTIQSIPIENIDGSTRRLIENGNAEQGAISNAISNMVRTMARSPHVVQGYGEFRRALAGGELTAKLREQIALIVAQANHCEYSLAQHAAQAEQWV